MGDMLALIAGIAFISLIVQIVVAPIYVAARFVARRLSINTNSWVFKVSFVVGIAAILKLLFPGQNLLGVLIGPGVFLALLLLHEYLSNPKHAKASEYTGWGVTVIAHILAWPSILVIEGFGLMAAFELMGTFGLILGAPLSPFGGAIILVWITTGQFPWLLGALQITAIVGIALMAFGNRLIQGEFATNS